MLDRSPCLQHVQQLAHVLAGFPELGAGRIKLRNAAPCRSRHAALLFLICMGRLRVTAGSCWLHVKGQPLQGATKVPLQHAGRPCHSGPVFRSR